MARSAASNRFQLRDSGTSLLFDGTTSTVIVPHASAQLLTSGMTLSAWIKPRSVGENGNGHIIAKSTGTSAQNGFALRVRAVDKLAFIVNAGTDISPPSGSLIYNVWQHALVTVASDATVTFYINGVQTGTPATTGALSGITTTNDLTIGNRSAATDRTFDGWIDQVRIWNRVLTAQEISDLYLLGTASTTGLIGEYLFNEGAGTVATDTSASANNGAITAATYSADVPMKARKQINGNKVKNGNFEYAPPFTAATTTAGRWIDGTSGGSTTNTLFNWATLSGAVVASASASFDTTIFRSGSKSLKLDLADASGTMAVGNTLSSSTPATADVLVPLTPNTTYVFTAYCKTTNVATNSAFAFIREFNQTLASTPATNTTNRLSGTNDWTLITSTFTTSATTRFGVIAVFNNVAGNVSTAWFDDISLLPVYPEGRVPANGNLVKNFNFEVAPTFVAAGATSARWIDGTSAGSTTNSTYKWAFAQETGTGLVQYDSSTAHLGTYSMKLSTTATGSLVQVAPVLSTNAADVVISGIRATPSTDYTLTFWMKTNYVSGDSNDGAYILVSFSDSFGTGLSSSSSTKIKTTTDWTQYTLNFTTTSLTQIIYPRLRIEGSTGTATLIMDAWFDDIYLAKTTNPGRIQIT